MEDTNTDITRLRIAAEDSLRREWRGDVRLDVADILRDAGRNRVVRFHVAHSPCGSPKTVVVKAAVGSDDDPFDPEKDQAEGAGWRFYNEWASTAFLNSLNADPPFCAKIYAGERTQGVIVLEDFGEGDSVATHMQGSDRPALEAALFVYAGSLGRMHAATVGHEGEYKAIRRSIGGKEIDRQHFGAKWLTESLTRLLPVMSSLGLEPADGFSSEAEKIAMLIDEPGPFLAFSAADMCPDNQRLIGKNSMLVYDFEFAGFHHALLDAAYLLVPWPTCWCANRMPEDLSIRLIDTYRAAITPVIPDAGDDTIFWSHMVACCVYWVMNNLGWSFPDSLKADSNWGIASNRQRHIQSLTDLEALIDERKNWPAVRETVGKLAGKLRELWPDTDEMQLYPPFR